jgi:hypothetical protein
MSYSIITGNSQPLHSIAHARTGDKGDTSLISVIPFAPEMKGELRGILTSDRVADHFGMAPTDVTVFGPTLEGVFIIRLSRRLSGGVTRSLSPDPHGKTLAFHLLEMVTAS